MSGPKYYTQFIRKDLPEGQNECSGVVELNQAITVESDARDVEGILARNFDIEANQVKLISWSRLH